MTKCVMICWYPRLKNMGGKGTGVHMNEEQLINMGGGVSGDQGESATHLASSNYLFGGSIGES